MRGVDVSHWNGTLVWPAIKAAGYEFAFMKRSEPKNYFPIDGLDKLYDSHLFGADQEDIPFAPYHFWRYYGTAGPEGQIDAFLEAVWPSGKPTCKYIVLDAEDKYAPKLTLETKRRLARSLVHLEANLPLEYAVLIYSARWWWDAWLGNDDVLLENGTRVVFAKWPLWCADYGTPAGKPRLPLTGSWTSALFHQYTDKGVIPNAGDESIDLNITSLTVEQLRVPEDTPTLTLDERVEKLEQEARKHGWAIE